MTLVQNYCELETRECAGDSSHCKRVTGFSALLICKAEKCHYCVLLSYTSSIPEKKKKGTLLSVCAGDTVPGACCCLNGFISEGADL